MELLIDNLFGRCFSVVSFINVMKEIPKLESEFLTIQAVLNDAEKGQVKDEAVKLWLDKLKDVFYQMDDVLDEWYTAMIKAVVKKQKKEEEEEEEEEKEAETSAAKRRKVWPFNNLNFSIRFHFADNIMKLREKLAQIEREGEIFKFVLNRGNEEVERPKTTSFVDVSEIYGREKVMDNLVSILLGKSGEEEKSPHVISIVGMGGVGKTAIAQLAYNDPKVEEHFEIKMWICASNPFDQCTVAKLILESIDHQCPNLIALQSLLDRICEMIREKKFFLVLDDVWTENNTKWKPFKEALKHGSKGSRILVTTRNKRVANKMESAHIINLEGLSDEDCWLMFCQIACADKDLEQRKQLKDLGRQIALKCKGLPLVAKTLGSLMHCKNNREEWKNVLDSNLWELEKVEEKVEGDLFASLLLSYHDLSPPMKRCFSYCAVFPKDYIFSSDTLVFLWMAQGYIDSKENMNIEFIAREYFEILASHSLFHDFMITNDDGMITNCKMHAIVHDFAKLIAKKECFTIKSEKKLVIDFKNARHLFLEIPKKAQFPMSIYKDYNAKNLRTLILDNQRDYDLYNLFTYFRCLRALILNCRGCHLKKLPNSVDNCIHLRFLTLLNYCANDLPETICNLCNLQVLDILFSTDDTLKRLPQGMGKLINLRHLKLSPRNLIIQFPRGMGRLTSLRTLHCFGIGFEDDSNGCKFGELKNLNQLCGFLEIKGLGNVVDLYEVKNAQLKNKLRIHRLYLSFNGIMENNVSVLNAIEFPPNLESLSIAEYSGTKVSLNWMMPLTKLKVLDFVNMYLESLPPLGKLPFLEYLNIWNVDGFKKVGVEFLGIESTNKEEDEIIVFPNLKSLKFKDLGDWKEWIGIEGMRKEDVTIMPNLQELNIQTCAKLKSLPDFLCTTPLKKLQILGSPILSKRCQTEDRPKISHIPDIDIDDTSYSKIGILIDSKTEYDKEEYGGKEDL